MTNALYVSLDSDCIRHVYMCMIILYDILYAVYSICVTVLYVAHIMSIYYLSILYYMWYICAYIARTNNMTG